MLRVTVRGTGLPTITIGPGGTIVFGREPTPDAASPRAATQFAAEPGRHTLSLPQSAPHTSRVLGELFVGDEMVRLRWLGTTEGTLSSLFEAPGGPRRVTLA